MAFETYPPALICDLAPAQELSRDNILRVRNILSLVHGTRNIRESVVVVYARDDVIIDWHSTIVAIVLAKART